MAKSCLCLFMILGQASLAAAAPAAATPQLRGQQAVSPKDVESTLLAELAATFRPSATGDHINVIEEALRPMYTAVPKEKGGILGHAVVRYMLHRFFAQRNGWFIRGLEPGSGEAKNGTGPADLQALHEWIPSYLQGFVEQLQGGRGISLRELAVLAATLEDLIHKESNQRLEQAFAALEIPQETELDEAQLRQTLEVYMMIYMLGGRFKNKGQQGVMRAHKVFTDKLKDWGAVQEWMNGIQMEVAPRSATEKLNFSDASRVVEEVGKRYGTYNLGECNSLKSEMLSIESTKAGRVRLNEFYKKGLSGVFQFNEKPDYLRTLGALDDTNPEDMYVIMPNYIASRPNCLAASGFYAICCQNECEDLMGSLESKFQAAAATPEKIIELVKGMTTPTVTAPRELSESMVQRLNGIAAANGGKVPLHGRLFAQWMHHGFPRECPYPQQSGSTSPQTPDEWMLATGEKDSKLAKEELQEKVDSDSCTAPKGPAAREQHALPENELPWDEKEELLHPVVWDIPDEEVVPVARRSFFSTIGFPIFVAGLAAAAWKLTPEKNKARCLRRRANTRDGLMF